MGLDHNLQLIMSGVLNVTQLIGVSTSLLTMDRFGRRPLLLWGSFFMTVAHVIISILVAKFSNDWPGHRVAGWVSVGFLLFYMLSFGATWGPVGWSLPAEVWPGYAAIPHIVRRIAAALKSPVGSYAETEQVFPSSLRSRGCALATSSNWLNNFIIGLVSFPNLSWQPCAIGHVPARGWPP